MERKPDCFLCIEPQYIRYNVPMTHASLLQDLIDLYSALKSDRVTGLDEKKQRDREIGQALQSSRNHPERQVRGWLGQVSISGRKHQEVEGVQLYHLLCLALVIAGLVAGWVLAQAVLYYTGDRPINIVNALALLVLPQIFLLLLWLLSSMPWKIPLFDGLLSTLRFLNPGRLARHFALLSAERRQQSLAVLWDKENMISLMPTTHWLFSFWSQLFALSFNTGVLVAAFYMISFSDLAFVWSSTLSLDSSTFHSALTALSWPWSMLFPAAVPSLELVEASRYYRLEGGSLGDGAVAPALAIQLSQWWPFLLASIVSYGFAPRLLTLIFSWFRLRYHLGHALILLPGAPELLARMNSPLISTVALQPEHASQAESTIESSSSGTSEYDLKCVVIGWSGAGDQSGDLAKQLEAFGIESKAFLAAGGTRSTDEDNATIDSLKEIKPEGVVVIVKAWEPPLLELLDFIVNVRAQFDHQSPIIVLLWGGNDHVTEQHRDTWQMSLRQLKDSDLHLETLGPTI